METHSVILPFKSINKILWCDHLNETSLAVLLHGTICFSILNFYKNELWDFFLNFVFWHPWEFKGFKSLLIPIKNLYTWVERDNVKQSFLSKKKHDGRPGL